MKKTTIYINIIIAFIIFISPISSNAFNSQTYDDFDSLNYLKQENQINKDWQFKKHRKISLHGFLKYIYKNKNIDINTYEVTNRTKECGLHKYSKKHFQYKYIDSALNYGIIECNQNFLNKKTISRVEALNIVLKAYNFNIDYFIDQEYEDEIPRRYSKKYNHTLYNGRLYGLISDYKNLYYNLSYKDAAYLIYKANDRQSSSPFQIININGAQENEITGTENYKTLNRVWKTIENSYLHNENIELNNLVDHSIKGFVDGLDDQYTKYFTKEEAESLNRKFTQTYSGIGVYISQKFQYITIIDVIEGGGAEAAGLRKDDIILKVNDQSIVGKSTEYAASKILGEEGTTVKLTIQRDENTIDYIITRKKIVIKSMKYEKKDNAIYLKISSFQGQFLSELEEAIKFIQTNNNNKIIIDLRNNPGGFLNYSIEFLDVFTKKGEVLVKTQNNTGRVIEYKSSKDGQLHGHKVYILTNNNSASASEIVAGALQDYNYATIIGETTYGKGTAQSLIEMYNGGILKMTTEHWLTPNDRLINKKGITPDIEIEDSSNEELDKGIDRILEYALKN